MGKTTRSSTTELIRSSVAEYLTFLAASGDGGVEAIYTDESIWPSQKMMADREGWFIKTGEPME